MQQLPPECTHNAHLFYLKLKTQEQRADFIRTMKANGVSAVFHFVPLHSAPAGLRYGRFSGEDVYTTADSERLVRLPLYYRLPEADCNTVIEQVQAFFANSKKAGTI